MKDLDMFVIEEGHKQDQRTTKETKVKEEKVGFCRRHRYSILVIGYIYLFGWVLMQF